MRVSRFTVGFLTVIMAAGLFVRPDAASGAKSPDELFLEKKIIARWHITSKTQLEAARARDIDILEETPNVTQGYFTILVNAEELSELRQDGYVVDVLNYDWYESYAAGVQVPNGGFRTFAQAVAKMDSIVAEFPDIAHKEWITITEGGNFVWLVKISDNPLIDEDEPQILFTGMHHAREPISMEVLLETMDRLTQGYGVDTFITRLVNEREIYFIPVVNPDGYLYNELIAPDGGGMWRKNRRDNATWPETYGVDPNRNYGYKWGLDNVGSSGNPGSDTYRGPAPFSEPETAAIRDLVNSKNFVFMINYHSYSNLYLWPWGYDFIYTDEDDFFSAVGESLAAYNGYTPTVGWGLYRTNGDADDWAYGASTEHTPVYAFTPEIGTSADGFWPNPSRIPVQIEENQGPNFVIIDLAENPYRVFPPGPPVWIGPDTVIGADFSIHWQDTTSPVNAAVAYRVEELIGPYDKMDDAEGPVSDWALGGWAVSTTRAYSGTKSYHGGYAHGLKNRMTALEHRRVQPGDSVFMRMWYDIESNWDYAYVEVAPMSTGQFATLPGTVTTNFNPNNRNRGNGITGSSGGAFVLAKFSLGAYVGQDILVRLSYETDQAVLGAGIWVDDIRPLQAYATITTVAASTPDTFHAFTGKSAGEYLYRVWAFDNDGQTSTTRPPSTLTVLAATNGDMNADGVINVVDLALLIDHVFADGPGATVPGMEECNGSAGVNVLDVVHLIDFLFRGGAPPQAAP